MLVVLILANILPNIKTIGVNLGAVFSKIIKNLDVSKSSVKEVVQIMGTAASDDLKYGYPWVVQALSDKLQVPCTNDTCPYNCQK